MQAPDGMIGKVVVIQRKVPSGPTTTMVRTKSKSRRLYRGDCMTGNASA